MCSYNIVMSLYELINKGSGSYPPAWSNLKVKSIETNTINVLDGIQGISQEVGEFTVYWSILGDDNNDGRSYGSPVLTWSRIKEILIDVNYQTIRIICMTDNLTIDYDPINPAIQLNYSNSNFYLFENLVDLTFIKAGTLIFEGLSTPDEIIDVTNVAVVSGEKNGRYEFTLDSAPSILPKLAKFTDMSGNDFWMSVHNDSSGTSLFANPSNNQFTSTTGTIDLYESDGIVLRFLGNTMINCYSPLLLFQNIGLQDNAYKFYNNFTRFEHCIFNNDVVFTNCHDMVFENTYLNYLNCYGCTNIYLNGATSTYLNMNESDSLNIIKSYFNSASQLLKTDSKIINSLMYNVVFNTMNLTYCDVTFDTCDICSMNANNGNINIYNCRLLNTNNLKHDYYLCNVYFKDCTIQNVVSASLPVAYINSFNGNTLTWDGPITLSYDKGSVALFLIQFNSKFNIRNGNVSTITGQTSSLVYCDQNSTMYMDLNNTSTITSTAYAIRIKGASQLTIPNTFVNTTGNTIQGGNVNYGVITNTTTANWTNQQLCTIYGY